MWLFSENIFLDQMFQTHFFFNLSFYETYDLFIKYSIIFGLQTKEDLEKEKENPNEEINN